MRGPKGVSWFVGTKDRKKGTLGVATGQSDGAPGLPVLTSGFPKLLTHGAVSQMHKLKPLLMGALGSGLLLVM